MDFVFCAGRSTLSYVGSSSNLQLQSTSVGTERFFPVAGCGKQTHFGLGILRRILPLVMLLTLLSSGARGGEESDLEAVLELPLWDHYLSVQPEWALKVCSEALARRESIPLAKLLNIYFYRGQALSALGKFEEAKKDFEEVLKLSPKSYHVRWARARENAHLGKVDEAVKELKELIELEPDFEPAYAELAALRFIRGQYDQAENYSSKAIALDDQSYFAFKIRGLAFFARGDYRRAVANFDQAIALAPYPGIADPGINKPEQLYLRRGKALCLLGEYVRAVSNYQMALRLAPNSFEASFGLVETYHASGRHQVALKLAEELVRQHERQGDAFYVYALCLIGLHRFEEAKVAADKAVALNPQDGDARYALGLAYECSGKYAQALRNYNKALELKPSDPCALRAKAYFLATCPDKEFRDGKKALEVAQEGCRKTKDKDLMWLMVLAAAHAECGEFAQAEGVIRKCLAFPEALVGGGLKEQLEKELDLFKDGKPYRGQYDSLRTQSAP